MQNILQKSFRAFKLSLLKYRQMKSDPYYLDWYYEERPRLQQFKNIHAGADCFIIGNGPSLNQMDLSPLNNYYCFGLNKIFLLFEKQPLQLSYHVAVNPLVIEQMATQLASGMLGCPSFVAVNRMGNTSVHSDSLYKLLTTGKWSFYHTVEEPIAEGFTVTYVAMQLAYYMGFQRVFLLGVDHNFQQKGKPNEEQVMKEEDVNHFHPDYFKGMNWQLADLEGSEASYSLARHQFHETGRQLFDCTHNGKLTIFPKISFEQALSIAKKK